MVLHKMFFYKKKHHFTHTYFESKIGIWYSETYYSLTQKNGFTGSTLSMQNAKLQSCVQTTDRKGLCFSDILDQCSR